MTHSREITTEVAFVAGLIGWRGPSPFFFLRVPDGHVDELRRAALYASYGWGCVPVGAEVDGSLFRTSLFPKDGGYLVPVRTTVRRAAGLAVGGIAGVRVRVVARASGRHGTEPDLEVVHGPRRR